MNSPVDGEIYKAVSEAVSPDFAFSYLVKAEQHGRRITPFTRVAWERLTSNPYAMEVLNRLGVTLVRPQPWSEVREERKRNQRIPHQDQAA
ncbi:hypothetical protein [Brevundimonas sp. Marseille-Q4549]